MVTKFFDNRGRCWKCRSCKSIFFIPEVCLEEQKKVGCSICGKGLWKTEPYINLFINNSSKECVKINDNPKKSRKGSCVPQEVKK